MIYGHLYKKILLREIPLGKLINISHSHSGKMLPRAEKNKNRRKERKIGQWKGTKNEVTKIAK
jgi:hypothetical protein